MDAPTRAQSPHRFRFFRAGGVDQVRFETGADLLALDQLDPKLWVALACPTTSIEYDARFLKLLDADGDGRIRVGDVLAAVKFLRPLLKNPDDLLAGKAELPLSAINEGTPEGGRVLDAARNALLGLGKREATSLSVEDAAKALDAFHKMPVNGDGVVTPGSADDPALQAALADIVGCMGGEKDRSGEAGASMATLKAFFDDAQAHLSWLAEPEKDAAVLPLGDASAAAFELVRGLEAKVEDYFARVRLAAFDARAAQPLNRDEKEFAVLAQGALSADVREVAGFPLARIEAERPLPLTKGVNPAWAEQVAKFKETVLAKLLGEREALTLEEWRTVRARFAPYEAWQGRKAGAKVEKLARARLSALCENGVRAQLEALVQKDLTAEPLDAALRSVEKLAYFVRDLHGFANNFVNFSDFYSRRRLATFQAGTLYIDQRSCELCLQVENAAAHAALGGLSRAYLAYCDCVRKTTGQKITIAAAITAGDSDNLMVGRNGLFVDRRGGEWDATVVRIVENPISVRQAFWSPYKKLIRFVEQQVASRASAKEAAVHEEMTQGVTKVADAAQGAPVPPPAPPAPTPAKRAAIDVGVVAALGVAVGGITAALGALMQSLFGLGLWMPVGVAALLFAISGPSMLIAYLKLRQRNVGPLLDANGWAINTLARVNVVFGGALTRTAALPPNASRDLTDPFAEKKRPWTAYVAIFVVAAVLILWALGRLDPWLPEAIQAGHVFGWAETPPPTPPPPPVQGP